MSHDIYNYGEGLIGKVAANHSHKWVFQETQEQEINLISSWSNPADSHPRTWEAQFQSGIKTIALIAVREGVVQLGSMKKVAEDLSYVVMLRRKFGYLESIPGVLLPHPSSAMFPAAGGCVGGPADVACSWPPGLAPPVELYDPYGQQAAAAAPMQIVPSMGSLEALLSKLPSVDPAAAGAGGMAMVGKEEVDAAADHATCHGMDDDAAAGGGVVGNGGESTSVAAVAATTAAIISYYADVAKPGGGL
uniref:Transcription factor MYC/MYB N-terminal domain-containing protein n=1 Tax=Arundo donax TaxID=35708 RepID=A0A0A9DL45_ARUDO